MRSLIAQVDALFAKWDKPESPGCALGIIQDSELIYSRGYGMSNLDYGIPITPESVFEIASTSKQFTAACIVLLAQRGALSLDDEVHHHVPELPNYGHTITIRHLMHHTSGLREYLKLRHFAGISEHDYHNHDAIELIARQKGLNFAPGSAFMYSNSGYVLMAEIVKRVSGQSLHEFAQENIFGPLGMQNTRFNDDWTQIVQNRAVSYAPRVGGGFRRLLKTSDDHGSSGLLTTVQDLYLWDQNFYHAQVGGSDFMTQMLAPGKLNDGQPLHYASGLFLETYRGVKTVEHPGTDLGFRTQMMRFPAQRFTVICLFNLSTANPTTMCQRVAGIFLDDRLSAQAPEADLDWIPSKESLGDQLGLYLDRSSGAYVELRIEGGKLWAEILGMSVPVAPVPVKPPADRTRIRYGSAGRYGSIAFTLAREPAGGSWHLDLDYGGIPMPTMTKVDTIVSLTTSQLEAFAGNYTSEELQTTYRLVVVDGELRTEHKISLQGTLRPGPQDVFVLDGLSFFFERDGAGRVTGFKLMDVQARHIRFEKLADSMTFDRDY